MQPLKLQIPLAEIDSLLATCQEGAADAQLDLRSRFIMHALIRQKALKLRQKLEREGKVTGAVIKLEVVEALVLKDYLKGKNECLLLVQKIDKTCPLPVGPITFLEQ